MSDANVLSALDRNSNGYKRSSLSNILIYGRVRCLIERPSIVGDGIKESNGYFAIVDAYALKCLGEDYFREDSSYDINRVYFTKGSILIYIDNKKWVGKDVKIFGKNKSYGATIRRQDSNKKEEGISAFVFGPPVSSNGKKSVFPLVPNVIVELNSRDPDLKGTVLEDFIVSIASKKGEIPYPETLDSIIPYSGVDVYNELIIEDSDTDNNGSNDKQDTTPSNINTVVTPTSNNGERIDISKIDMKLTFHLSCQEEPEYFDSFKEDISLNSSKRDKFVKGAISEVTGWYRKYGMVDYDNLKKSFISRVVSNPQKRLGGISTISCKKYIDTFINNCDGLIYSDIDEESKTDMYLVRKGIEKLKSGVLGDSSLLYGNTGDKEIDSIPMLKNKLSFVINVIGTCTGIGYDSLARNLNYCARMNISEEMWAFMLLRCPYYLGLLSTGLSVTDCDVLYFSFGKVYDEGKMFDVNMKYRSYLIMLDTLNNCSQGKYRRLDTRGRGVNTFVKLSDFKNADCCYSSKALSNLNYNRFVGSSDIKELLEILLNINLDIPSKYTNVIKNNNWYSDDCFNELCEAGIVNTLENYCALERNIEQEFMIYEVFEKMGKLTTGITDETIEKVISQFEKDRGFKLEGLQREGIKLCKYRAGVLSGCAGSGKTTTSDCMTEVLKTIDLGEEFDDEIKIIYCTPTGKACRRLAEVVHATVKTIHSQFNVGLGGTSYLQGAYKKKKSDSESKNPTIYILDEMAMCSTELMYNIARNINDCDMIYFLGDVKQLPPIGGGCPFKILMQILPCVELGVSKRAAEGSLVNYNTSLINFMSEPYCRELLYDDKTFIAKDCDDASIARTVRNSFAGFIDGTMNGTKYSEDDVQVISGYQSKTKLSSTSRLNRPLQDLLRKDDRVLYYREVRDIGGENEPYYANDRVIYMNRNSYDICRYVYDGQVFHKVITFGCVNGEMGKLIGVVKSSNVIIDDDVSNIEAGKGFYANVSEAEFMSIKDRYDSKKDDLRDDSNFKNDDYYFVVVKVYDSDLRQDVLVLLRGRGRYSGADFCLAGADLDNLGLAYALTCHKMQGSQSKVVIAVFESSGSPEFMNRNMINTIITRSQGIVCCIGSVLGSNSMLNRGRLKVSKTDCRDILSVMSGNIGWLEE